MDRFKNHPEKGKAWAGEAQDFWRAVHARAVKAGNTKQANLVFCP
jgi:hypothetical protein